MRVRYLVYILVFALAVAIQFPLWFGRGGIFRMQELQAELASVLAANDRLREENNSVAAEIESLKRGTAAVEERARMRLGMVRDDEILFRFIPRGEKQKAAAALPSTSPKGGRQQIFRPKRRNLYIEGVPASGKGGKQQRQAAGQ